jgi:ABC-type bacteriocin/lantibiotic exporter with double-glycine peptidase domain
MVLAYQGIKRPQAELLRLLGTHPLVGTPYSNITRLRSPHIKVAYQKARGLSDLAKWLEIALPAIVFVQAGELPHWRGHWFQHALVVIGLEQEKVYLLDPASSNQTISVPNGDFLLAWEEMDLAYAVIVKRVIE